MAARSPERRRAVAPSTDGLATTANRILDVAERLVQARGFNAFSYADIAATLRITKSSLHYHFPTKTDLGTHLTARYAARFLLALDDISHAHASAPERLRGYIALYEGMLREDRACLCGMLATEFVTLAEPIRAALRFFFDGKDVWLTAVLETGRGQGDLRFSGAALDVARTLVATLGGAMMLARFRGDAACFDNATQRLLGSLCIHGGGAAETSSPHT